MAGTPSLFAGIGAQFLDNNGNILSGGKIYSYYAGTTTPISTYTTQAAVQAHPNPIILDAAGRVPSGGEIWLKEGDTEYYKFILKTSDDIVLGTYDYVPGTYEGLDLPNTTDPTKGDALIGFRQSNAAGNLPNAVGRTVHDKLQEIVSFKDFGAVGDGITNDATAIQNAINAMSSGGVIDGQNLTYKVTSKLINIASNTTIQNATFDFSSYFTGGNLIEFGGSLGAPVSLTADTLINTSIVIVGGTSTFAANDLVFLTSNSIWDSGTSTIFGQYARIKSIDSSTQITLFDNVNLSFNTANAASIAKVTPVKNVTFENVQIIGYGANSQIGIYLSYGEKCNFVRCQFTNIDYTALGMWRCYDSTVDSCRQEFAAYSGTAYAYAIWGGCYGCSVINSWGEDCRHTVTVGDNDGINMYTRVIGCHGISSKDAAFDTHSAAMFTLFMGNHVENSANRFLTSNHDGMISEGCHTSFIGNTIVGCKGVGISFIPRYTATGYPSTGIITGNKIALSEVGYGATSGQGIYALVNNGGSDIDSVVIKDNVISGGNSNVSGVNGIYVYALKASSTIRNVHIESNTVMATSGLTLPIFVRADGANSTVKQVTIKNNTLESTSSWAIQVYSNNASATIKDVSIGGNIIYSASGNGIYLFNSAGTINNVKADKNIYNIGGTISIENNGGTDVIIDDFEYNASVNFTGSPAVIDSSKTTNWYTFNRGATITVTLPSATESPGRILHFLSYQNFTVVSASSDVVPATGGAAGTAILPATSGSWVDLRSNGTNWDIVRQG